MNVDFYATLRDVTGTKTVEFDLPECSTVRQLIAAMISRFPALREKLLQEDGNLWGHVHVFINGRDARFLDDEMDAQISFSDRVSVFPAVGGGSK
jgi:sulfur-carrier protein